MRLWQWVRVARMVETTHAGNMGTRRPDRNIAFVARTSVSSFLKFGESVRLVPLPTVPRGLTTTPRLFSAETMASCLSVSVLERHRRPAGHVASCIGPGHW
jgi:hypothetical protein